MECTISLINPDKNCVVKQFIAYVVYREAEEKVAILNSKLTASQKNKDYFWRVTQIGRC